MGQKLHDPAAGADEEKPIHTVIKKNMTVVKLTFLNAKPSIIYMILRKLGKKDLATTV